MNPIASTQPSPSSAQFAHELQRVRQEERAHLARELHDELGALLTVAKLDVARVRSSLRDCPAPLDQRLKHLSDTLNAGMALKSHLVEGLLPSCLAKLGATDSVRALAQDFRSTTGIPVTTQIDSVELDESAQLAVYRLVQECLTNIGKYAGAREVWIDLLNWQTQVAVTVKDNGTGFDTMRVEKSHRGLVGIRERIEACGGEFCVFSAPGKGTQVMALLPAHRAKAEPARPARAGRQRRAPGNGAVASLASSS
jgi:signal transduction histidine kinase